MNVLRLMKGNFDNQQNSELIIWKACRLLNQCRPQWPSIKLFIALIGFAKSLYSKLRMAKKIDNELSKHFAVNEQNILQLMNKTDDETPIKSAEVESVNWIHYELIVDNIPSSVLPIMRPLMFSSVLDQAGYYRWLALPALNVLELMFKVQWLYLMKWNGS